MLLHFLNNILKPVHNIEHVELLNPYNEKDYDGDKLTIVDIKAQDRIGILYQVEIQLSLHTFLPERMLYTWSDLYQSQLGSGDSFNQLKPAVSIWILPHTLIADSDAYHHHFQTYDLKNQQLLNSHFAIHVLELSKWEPRDRNFRVLDEDELWYYFFKEAKEWDELPSIINTPEMRQAMSVLEQFSEREADYHRYQARQNFIREQKTIQEQQEALEKALQEALEKALQEALEEKQEALEEKQEALEEKERLLALLKEANIDPGKK